MGNGQDRLQSALEEVLVQQLAGAEGPCPLSLAQTRQIAQRVGCGLREVEIAALAQHILPERYRRNLGTAGWDGQAKLLQSTVAVIGAGGLGGWIIEGLARMGIGHLMIVDGDRFEENNLNRQLGCTEATLGMAKADCLRDRVAQVNSAVEVTVQVAWLGEENAQQLIHGAQVIVDALDTLPARLLLERVAAQEGIPLVHGAIGGYTGQLMTILPGDPGLRGLYGDEARPDRGVETVLGNPSATPMMIAAWQIQEVVKILLGQGELVRNRLLLMDALYGQVTEMQLSEPD